MRLGKRPSERSRELIQGLEKLVFLQSKKPHILWVIGYALVARYCFRSRGNSPRLVLLYFQIINFKSIPRKKSKLLSSVQSSCSVVSNSATPLTTACQASLSITNSRSLPKLMSIESVMPSNISSSHPLLSLSPPELNLSQHQGLFK